MTPAELGARLKAAREALGLQSQELAARVGCSKAALSHIESGRNSPRGPLLVELCRHLRLTLADLERPIDPHTAILAGQPRPTWAQVSWVLEHVADHIEAGGTHRGLWAERLGLPGMPTAAARTVAEAKCGEAQP